MSRSLSSGAHSRHPLADAGDLRRLSILTLIPLLNPSSTGAWLGETEMMCSKASVFWLAVASIILASTGSASAQIVALGHSAVRGHVAENEMWPAVLASMLRARGSQVHVINAGIDGETTAEELARVDSAKGAGHQDHRCDGILYIGPEATGHGAAGPTSFERRRV
jgi:hypothetical protein